MIGGVGNKLYIIRRRRFFFFCSRGEYLPAIYIFALSSHPIKRAQDVLTRAARLNVDL